MRIDRRRALALLGAAAPATGATAAASKGAKGAASFNHGVASGDPATDGVVLWTRITPPAGWTGDVAYTWRINPVDRRAGGAKTGRGTTGSDRDYTAKVEVSGLDAGRAYTFEFESGGIVSPLGRTATLPAAGVKDVVMAVASCALFPNGYFNAYQAIADLPRVDVVIHLGDYIYEYGGPGSYGMDSVVAEQRPHDPPHEAWTLDDYRRRHAQYKSDPQLQAAHARAPWIVVWDDHETANDSYREGAENHQAEVEGDWNLRKAAALKAYYEWMPIRAPSGGKPLESAYRSFHFGDLASLIMIETRLTARDRQLTYERDLPGTDGKPDVEGFRRKLEDPKRTMMGPGQLSWLAAELERSEKAGHAWQVIGNEVVMARVKVPRVRQEVGEAVFDQAVAGAGPAVVKRLARMDSVAQFDLPYGLDMWDGYAAERQRLYSVFTQAKAHPIVLAGDSHAFWANELYDAPEGGVRVAAEFGATAITSPGAGDVLTGIPVGEAFAKANREVLYNNSADKGFVLLTLRRDEAVGQMVAVSTIAQPTFETKVLKAYRLTPQAGGGVSPLTEV